MDSVKGTSCRCDGDDDDACIERYIRLDMEPLTGLVVQARKALMLSTHIGPRYRVVDSGLVAKAFVPIMEVEERGVGDVMTSCSMREGCSAQWGCVCGP